MSSIARASTRASAAAAAARGAVPATRGRPALRYGVLMFEEVRSLFFLLSVRTRARVGPGFGLDPQSG